jgi:glycosyltransferase involved in cell wall biosynthesis
MAPNQMLVETIQNSTKRPAFLMQHGVDFRCFRRMPSTRDEGQPFCIGYVGRLTTEKNIRLLAELEDKLLAAGETNFKFLVVGEGGQKIWLEKHLRSAEIPGVLRGEQLAAAYNRMDAFVFPSLTDTFGLVILEAMATGVPVILAPETGKRIGIEDGVSGLLSEDFAGSLLTLMHNSQLRHSMSAAATAFAGENGWDHVFEQIYETYDSGLRIEDQRREQSEALIQNVT